MHVTMQVQHRCSSTGSTLNGSSMLRLQSKVHQRCTPARLQAVKCYAQAAVRHNLPLMNAPLLQQEAEAVSSNAKNVWVNAGYFLGDRIAAAKLRHMVQHVPPQQRVLVLACSMEQHEFITTTLKEAGAIVDTALDLVRLDDGYALLL